MPVAYSDPSPMPVDRLIGSGRVSGCIGNQHKEFINMTRTVTKSMLQTLLEESRSDIVKSKEEGRDTFSIVLQVSPVYPEELGDLAHFLEFEVDCLSRTGKFSFNKDFMPPLSKFTCFERYYVESPRV